MKYRVRNVVKNGLKGNAVGAAFLSAIRTEMTFIIRTTIQTYMLHVVKIEN